MRYQSRIKLTADESKIFPISQIKRILTDELIGTIQLDYDDFTEDMLDPNHLAFYINIDELTGNLMHYLVYVMEDIKYDETTKNTIYGHGRKYRGGFIS